MSAKTKIIVLRMKELIYTGIFIALGLLLIILLIVVFSPKKREEAASPTQEPTYVPGIYTTSLMLNDRTVDIAVTVDENNIISILIIAPLDIRLHNEPIISSLDTTPTPIVDARNVNALVTIDLPQLFIEISIALNLSLPLFNSSLNLEVRRIA